MRRRVLTITLEFEVVDRKAYQPRLAAAYDAAVSAAVKAVTRELLEGSVATYTSRMCYDTRTFDTDYEDIPLNEASVSEPH
jgi:hypothetical protein